MLEEDEDESVVSIGRYASRFTDLDLKLSSRLATSLSFVVTLVQIHNVPQLKT